MAIDSDGEVEELTKLDVCGSGQSGRLCNESGTTLRNEDCRIRDVKAEVVRPTRQEKDHARWKQS